MLESSTIITLIIVLGYVWGGTAYFLYCAFKREANREGSSQ